MEGIKRINEMAIGQKDQVLLEVVKYLISRQDMNEKYLNEEKTLKGMASYIESEIMKDFCEKMNTTNPASFAKEVKYNGNKTKCLVVGMSEERTFELAINYFNKSNKELGIKNEETKKKDNELVKDENKKFGSIFGVIQTSKIAEKKEDIEQISLFG